MLTLKYMLQVSWGRILIESMDTEHWKDTFLSVYTRCVLEIRIQSGIGELKWIYNMKLL